MNYIDEDTAFERWCENNYLPIISQAIWKKLFKRFNRSGWCEWVTVDNQTLMAEVQIRKDDTFISYRNKLVEAGLIEYIKGKKGSPNKYRLIPFEKYTYLNGVQSGVYTGVQSGVYTGVQSGVYTGDINKHNKDKTNNNDDDACARACSEVMNVCLADQTRDTEGFIVVQKHFERQLGNLLSPDAVGDILDFLERGAEPELICKAINLSVDNGKRNWRYTRKIVLNCLAENILTVSQYEIHEANREASKRSAVPRAASVPAKRNRYQNFKGRERDYVELEKLERQYLQDSLEAGEA